MYRFPGDEDEDDEDFDDDFDFDDMGNDPF